MQEEGAEGHFVCVCVCVSNRGIKWDRQTGFSEGEPGVKDLQLWRKHAVEGRYA